MPLPRSGAALVELIDALAIRKRVLERTRLSAQTLARVAREDTKVHGNNISDLLEAIPQALFPDDVLPLVGMSPEFASTWHRGVTSLLSEWARLWDGAVGILSELGSRVSLEEGWLSFARVLSADLAARWAFARRARAQALPDRSYAEAFVQGHLFATVLSGELEKRSWTRSQLVQELANLEAEEHRISKGSDESAARDWLRGEYLPSEDNLSRLARALAGGQATQAQVHLVELDLHLARGCDDLLRKVPAGDQGLFRKGFATRTAHAANFVFSRVKRQEASSERWWEAVAQGASSPLGRSAWEAMAETALAPADAAVIQAILVGDWVPCVQLTLANLTHPREKVLADLRRAMPCLPEEQLEPCLQAVRVLLVLPPQVGPQPQPLADAVRAVYGTDHPATTQEMGEIAAAVGDHREAALAARLLLRKDPLNASAHFKLGCALGELVKEGELDLVQEALHHLHMAEVASEPEGHMVAAVERGIVLIHAERLKEAQEAILGALTKYGARPDAVTLAHAHYHLGVARLREADLVGARGALEEAVRLNPRSGLANDLLAWVLLQQGDRQGARRFAKEAARLGQPETLLALNQTESRPKRK